VLRRRRDKVFNKGFLGYGRELVGDNGGGLVVVGLGIVIKGVGGKIFEGIDGTLLGLLIYLCIV